MSKKETEILFLIILIIISWQIIKALYRLIDRIFENFTETCDTNHEWYKNAPYTNIVQETIYYTNDILFNHGIDHFPSYQIYYYKHKKNFGHFDGKVVVYTKNHGNVVELVDTVLHETKHFIQSQTDRDYKDYETYTKRYGAWDNPFEIQARQFAEINLYGCLLYLKEKGLVLKGSL